MTMIRSAFLMNALTIYWVMSNGFTGVRSRLLNWDGSITLIPVRSQTWRTPPPESISHVNAMAMRMMVKIITSDDRASRAPFAFFCVFHTLSPFLMLDSPTGRGPEANLPDPAPMFPEELDFRTAELLTFPLIPV